MNHSRGLFWLLIVLLGLLLGCESASEPSTSPLALGGELERSGEGTLSGETGIQSEGREDSTALEGIPVEGSGEGQERETALPDTGTDDPSSPSDSPASEEGQEENEDLPFEEPTCVENHCDFLFASATPPICQQGASCSTDSECPSSWAAAGQCTEGVCTSVQTECETASDCLAACEAAAALVEPGAFLDCSAQQWDCSPYSDCPNAPKLCTPYTACSTDADCASDWFREVTCESGWCTPDRRECDTDSACYDLCRETYASVYATNPGFTFCEDQEWRCESEGGCSEFPRRCAMYTPCQSNQDCVNTWTTSSTCTEGMCVYEFLECKDPMMCLDACLAYYESLDAPSDYCYANEWQCALYQ